MVAIEGAVEDTLGHITGALFLVLQADQHALAFTFHIRRGETRLGEHLAEQVQGWIEQGRVGQAAQGKPGHVTLGAAAHLRTLTFQAFGDGVGVAFTGTLIEQGIGEQGDARLFAITGAAGIEHHPHVHHGQFGGAHVKDAHTVGGGPVFDVGTHLGGMRGQGGPVTGLRRGAGAEKRDQGEEQPEDRAISLNVHDHLPSAWRAARSDPWVAGPARPR